MREQTCCFTGHRRIPAEEQAAITGRLERVIVSLYHRGIRYYGAGGALGFDTLASQTVIHLRESCPGMKLILVLPCLTQTRGWRPEDVAEYERIKSQADKIVYTSQQYIMKDGFVNQIGTPMDLFDRPMNLFVAGFIGMPVMNFFDNCKLLLEDGVYYAQIRGAKIKLDDFQQKALKQNGQGACDIVAGIRPQHISVGKGDLAATIEVNEMMGSEVHLHARSDADEVVMVIPTVDLDVDVSKGANVNFTTKPKLIQLFDKASGNNLIWYDKASAEAFAPVCKKYDF